MPPDAQPAPPPTHRSAAVRFIFITAVLDVLGFGLLIPVAPRLVEQLQGGSEAQAAPVVGLLSATFGLMLFLCAPVLGTLSDSVGRRPVILFALFGSGIDYLAQAVVPSVRWLFITRAINGLTGSSLSAANAYIADVTPPEKRAQAFGMMGAAFGVGFTFGPLIGGVLGGYNIRWPFIAAGALTLVNWLYGLFILPESLPPERRRPIAWKRANPVGALTHLSSRPLIRGLAAAMFVLNLAQFGLQTVWVLYTSYRYHWGEIQVGFSLFLVGIGAAVVQAGLAGRIIRAIGESRALVLATGLSTFTMLAYGTAPYGWMVYIFILIGSFAGVSQPAAQSLITKTVDPHEQGETQGALTALSSIAAIIGPLIGANVFAYFISERTPIFHGQGGLPGAPFYLGAVFSLIGWIIIVWALSRHGPRHVAQGNGAASPPIPASK